MQMIRFAAAALNQTPLDWSGNFSRIAGAIETARKQLASVVCLPELAITGYGCEDMFLSPGVCSRAMEQLQLIVPLTSDLVVAVGLPLFYRGSVFNVAAVMVNGRLAGFAAKQNLAGDGLHYEPRWFKPWPEAKVARITLADGQSVPLGDLVFDVAGVRMGFEICEDAWVADRPGSELAARGVDVILNPSASHFAFGKQVIRRRFVLEGSRAFAATYVYANLLGNEAGRVIYDGGCLLASGGSLLAEGRRFSFAEFEVVSAVADIDLTRNQQMRTVSRDLRLGDAGVENATVVCDFRFPEETGTVSDCPAPPAPIALAMAKEEEFTRAIGLALFDYARKSRTRGFVVSLSGGADSAAVACLVAMMRDLGEGELGTAAFRQRLGLSGEGTVPLRQLLTCVYQATENSSDTTRNAAKGLADAIAAHFVEWNIDDLVAGYVQRAEAAIDRKLSWDTDDIPLQNIQARVRAPGVWMLANLNNALLLATSNRSEAAVGYATMDGDTCGGLSPISGIDKAFLRYWLRWLETEGADHITPIPALSLINVQAPTAELRPAEAMQTDEDDLMPYPVLDAIECAAIRDKQLPADVCSVIRNQFSQYSADQIAQWVRRFFTLWSRNQWKRERYAPGFHVDDKNLDPKTWCRFPILSSGFADELSEL
ncbi:MAG: NAD+ synthase (glutamine-hydrolyzing) [Verrucomicrobiales bacterium]|jgi:NAD+ synthase (glutamine-hydrolysing)